MATVAASDATRLIELIYRQQLLIDALLDASPEVSPVAADGESLDDVLRRIERALIVAALADCKGNISATSRRLRTKRATLAHRMAQLGIHGEPRRRQRREPASIG